MLKEETSSLRGKELQIDKLIEELQEKIKEVNAKRVVIDTLASLFYRFFDPIERRTASVDLIESLSDLGATVLVLRNWLNLACKERYWMRNFLYMA